jgi:ATP-binding cassette subfamily B protein
MKDASILILDDSVSAVDTNTEKVIIENLRKNREGKTTLLIAHRISTVEKMDKIIFIDDGRLVAVGSHSELYEACPDYRTMVELQKLEEERGGN